MANQYPTVVSGTTPEIRVDTLDTTPVAISTAGNLMIRYIHVDNRANSLPTWLNIYDAAGGIVYAADYPARRLKVPAGVQGMVSIADKEGATKSFFNGVTLTAADDATLTGSNPSATFNVTIGIDT